MIYITLYVDCIISIWWTYRVGLKEALKKIFSVLIPSALIILFNAKTGRLLFRNPLIGIITLLPTAVLIYRGSLPFVAEINNWIDRKADSFVDSQEVVDAEVISKEDA